ncbi:MAG: hypothetical protein IKM65_06200 [Bacteroidaceae bacterium]|nr:hypothetical protein [Bacteroidaceae bacterium]
MKKVFTSIMLLMAAGTAFAQNAADKVQENEAAIKSYFAGSLAQNSGTLELDAPIALDNIEQTRAAVWSVWKSSVEAFDEEKLIPLGQLEDRKTGKWKLPASLEPNAIMPYYWGINTLDKVEGKLPLFLYMHGSGDKNQEWETGIGLSLRRFYSPAVYMVPQIPNTGEYYRWAIQSKQWAWEKLLRLAILNDTIDANRIYFFGISEGGYGSQRLASFYADYLAGAGPMAGGEPLQNAPMENVANIAFSLRTGALDDGFGRNICTQSALDAADSLAAAHPGYYNHYIELIPGDGHSIDYRPTTPWLAKYSRNPHPKYFYWENYDMYGRKRDGFYNLRVNSNPSITNSDRSCFEVKIDNNTIDLTVNRVRYQTTYSQGGIPMIFSKKFISAKRGNVTIYLNEELFDLSKPVKVILNGEEIFNGKVGTSLKTMIESCAFYYDPERLFPASIDIDIASKSAVPTAIENVKDEKKNNEVIYDISGRRVENTTASGIYIQDGKKILK